MEAIILMILCTCLVITGRACERGVQGVHRTWARKSWGCRVKFWTKFFFSLALHPSLNFFFFALHLILGKKLDQIWEKTFFLLFTWFWAKNWTKFEWRTFFVLHLILGKKLDQIWVKTFFDVSASASLNFGGPTSIFVPPGKISLWGSGNWYNMLSEWTYGNNYLKKKNSNHYTHCITPKPVTSLLGPSPRQCTCRTMH